MPCDTVLAQGLCVSFKALVSCIVARNRNSHDMEAGLYDSQFTCPRMVCGGLRYCHSLTVINIKHYGNYSTYIFCKTEILFSDTHGSIDFQPLLPFPTLSFTSLSSPFSLLSPSFPSPSYSLPYLPMQK